MSCVRVLGVEPRLLRSGRNRLPHAFYPVICLTGLSSRLLTLGIALPRCAEPKDDPPALGSPAKGISQILARNRSLPALFIDMVIGAELNR